MKTEEVTVKKELLKKTLHEGLSANTYKIYVRSYLQRRKNSDGFKKKLRNN